MSFPLDFQVPTDPLDQQEHIRAEEPFEAWDDEWFEEELYRHWPFDDGLSDSSGLARAARTVGGVSPGPPPSALGGVPPTTTSRRAT